MVFALLSGKNNKKENLESAHDTFCIVTEQNVTTGTDGHNPAWKIEDHF
jgi:hypothetical protein